MNRQQMKLQFRNDGQWYVCRVHRGDGSGEGIEIGRMIAKPMYADPSLQVVFVDAMKTIFEVMIREAIPGVKVERWQPPIRKGAH